MRFFWLLVLLTGLHIALGDAFAAQIKVVPEFSTPELSSIVISGDISQGDANEFLNIALNTKLALVFLASDGGDAAEGLLLGKAINRLGFGTAVIDRFRCMSACALIWLSGKTRFLSEGAVVGFHAVYNQKGVSSDGNALFGAYYNQLGLSDRAIRYLTSAPPDGYNPITLNTAAALDISVLRWEGDKTDTEEAVPTNNTQEFFVEEGVAISGYDIPNSSFKALSVTACYQACSSNSACKAYTYDIKNRVCYPKTGGRLIFPNRDSASGAAADVNQRLLRSTISLIRQTEVLAQSIREFKADHVEKCIYECEQVEACRAFTYSKKDQLCALKPNSQPRKKALKLLSGAKQ